jgi:hypothetical protein
VGANASEFATQKKLQDYAERIGDHFFQLLRRIAPPTHDLRRL